MKTFSFIFIVYVVVLLTQPCQDFAATVGDCGGTDTQIAHMESTSESDPQTDDCSPFCVCSCCSHPVANHKLSLGITSEIKYISIATTLAEYANPYTKTHQDSIWQPPKA